MRAGVISLLFVLLSSCVCEQIACNDLAYGQYYCKPPPTDKTNELQGCTKDGIAHGFCYVVSGVNCTGEQVWTYQVPCRYTNGYYFTTAISLSVFLGVFGIDRCYLGYPAIGMLKFFTFGGFLLGNLVDIILISTQTMEPNQCMRLIGDKFCHCVEYVESPVARGLCIKCDHSGYHFAPAKSSKYEYKPPIVEYTQMEELIEKNVFPRLSIKLLQPEQKTAISQLLAGKDVFVVMPTGAGKSLCYEIPSLISLRLLGPWKVLGPLAETTTKSLMIQLVDHYTENP